MVQMLFQSTRLTQKHIVALIIGSSVMVVWTFVLSLQRLGSFNCTKWKWACIVLFLLYQLRKLWELMWHVFQKLNVWISLAGYFDLQCHNAVAALQQSPQRHLHRIPSSSYRTHQNLSFHFWHTCTCMFHGDSRFKLITEGLRWHVDCYNLETMILISEVSGLGC